VSSTSSGNRLDLVHRIGAALLGGALSSKLLGVGRKEDVAGQDGVAAT
jgi:hypothetical protein